MKGLRPVAIIGIIALIALSWYSLNEESKAKESEYQTNLEEARTKAEMGIYVDANHSYNMAISIHDSLELRSEIADYYKESVQTKQFVDACLDIILKYPKDETGYKKLVEYYYERDDYDNCFAFINKAAKRNVTSNKIDKIQEAIYYTYKLEGKKASYVGVLFDGLYIVQDKEGNWGYYSEQGKTAIPTLYKQVVPFSYEEYAWVRDQEDNFYLINKDNEKKVIDLEHKDIEECSALSSGLMAAKINGRYTYVNANFERAFGDYEFATAFHNTMAAVRDKEGWYFINTSGERLTDKNYADVKFDEAKKAFRNSLAFVSEDGKGYYLTNAMGEKIGTGVWEDAHLFKTSEPTAVMLDGVWGFIDKEGNVVVDPQYEEARPFSEGFAPVKINGKWGYISSSDYKLVIPAEFDDAKEMNAQGVTFVLIEDVWTKLSLYRLNYR